MLSIAEYTFWSVVAILAYVHIGYWVLLVVCQIVPRRHVMDRDYQPAVSLVIAAHNEESVIREKLVNALQLDYPPSLLEILVGDDCSSDRTSEFSRQFADKGVQTLTFSARRGKAAVMNDLLAHARGEVAFLCDANVMFQPDALRFLLQHLADPQVGAVSGDVQLESEKCNFGSGESSYYRVERRLQTMESHIGSLMGVDGGMYVLRRDLFQPLPSDTILDDFVISMGVIQQGFRVYFEPKAIATEGATPSARTEFRRRIRLSAGAAQVIRRRNWPPLSRPIELWQFVSHKLLRWLSPYMGILVFLTNLMLWPRGTLYQGLFVGQMGILALAGCAWLSQRVRGTKLGGIAFYVTMSHIAMAIGLVKGFVRRQSGTWNKTERITTGPAT